jgi:hypothetical protein
VLVSADQVWSSAESPSDNRCAQPSVLPQTSNEAGDHPGNIIDYDSEQFVMTANHLVDGSLGSRCRLNPQRSALARFVSSAILEKTEQNTCPDDP